ISDANETAFSFATRKHGSLLSRTTSAGMKKVLQRKGWKLDQMCLSFIGYEGSADHVKIQRRLVKKIVSAHGGIGVGAGPGALYDQKKFDTPYIRDFLLERGALADVSETSANWSNLLPLYQRAIAQAGKAFADIGVQGWIMCHLSHSYHSGACLYFTFAFAPAEGREPIAQYDVVKSAVQQAFIDAGGTLSHHHAVGLEHSRWLADDISAPGVAMVRALFDGVDPGRNLNPGKIVE
ncbi:MAG TPA: FAD-linked oxidase C-terminal domain-containing protein, partial [Mycobacteriales bacterium]|nr:FAD-linked oxidase C-terminal domain-containing protein [Mycobacteriales bacterium]